MEKHKSINYVDEILISTEFNEYEARRFIRYIKNYKNEKGLNQIFIRIPGNWRSDNASRRILFNYLKEEHDYVIIETSPVLRAIFKTQLTIMKSDPSKVLKERK